MGETTGIQWTDHTFNPWWGCVKVSPACKNCYAATLSHRYGFDVWGPATERRFFGPKHWNEPHKWNASAEKAGVRRRVFCASMADVFETPPSVQMGDTMRAERKRLAALIEQTPSLDWLLLTKRPENILEVFPSWWFRERTNVWVGTTVESPEYLGRVAALVNVPATTRFISYEPALAAVTWPLDGIHWLIAGGESGSGHRAPEAVWMQSARDQCAAAGVAFFFKQWGGLHPKANGATLDGREWKQFPAQVMDQPLDEIFAVDPVGGSDHGPSTRENNS